MKYLIVTVVVFALIIGCKAEKQTQRSIAMILVNEFAPLNESNLSKQLNSDWNGIGEIEEYRENETSILFKLGNTNVVIALIPNALEEESLEYAVETAWYWENAEKELAFHNKHYIVYASSVEMQNIDLYLQLTRVVFSLCKLTNPVGIYWRGSSQVLPPDLFFSYAEKMHENLLPTPLWVKVTGFPNKDGGYFLYTTGLRNFKNKEIEILNYPGAFSQGFYFLTDIADYILKSKTILRNGDTIKLNDNKIMQMHYKKSMLNEKETVISILF